VALLTVLGIAALSRVPYDADHAEDAIIRLSWRTRGEQVRECRTPSPEELANLPVHMQRTEVCEGRVLSRHLLVQVDGRSVVDDTVRAAGVRGDRPLYVYYEIPVSPGLHALHVRFVPEATAASLAPGERSPPPAVLDLEARLDLNAGEIVLVTYDADRQALVARRSGRPGAR
jgi:hypothetical protein